MHATATGIDGVTFLHRDWKDLALAVTFDDDDDCEAIRQRFEAAAQTAIELAAIMKDDRAEKAQMRGNVIAFPGA